MTKAVFFDKDGTLVQDIPYNVDPARVKLYEGAAKTLKALKDQGFLLILVSNQSGVARGFFKEDALKSIEEKLQCELERGDVRLDAVYFCPHHPDGVVEEYSRECDCRKPKPGMLLTAAATFDIDMKNSWMVGDILHDMEAGNRAGCKTILINNGNETEWHLATDRIPTAITPNLSDAIQLILNIDKANERHIHPSAIEF
jgi:D-glycero-D-manno-heptose 1,7-bisphosphate phosphatase